MGGGGGTDYRTGRDGSGLTNDTERLPPPLPPVHPSPFMKPKPINPNGTFPTSPVANLHRPSPFMRQISRNGQNRHVCPIGKPYRTLKGRSEQPNESSATERARKEGSLGGGECVCRMDGWSAREDVYSPLVKQKGVYPSRLTISPSHLRNKTYPHSFFLGLFSI